MSTRLSFSLLVLIGALALWGMVGWGIWVVEHREDVAPAPVTDSDAIRLIAFARSTETARSALKTLTAVDVVSVARSVEEAGKKAGIVARVGGSTVTIPPTGKTAPALDSAFLAVDAQGTFAQLSQFLQYLEQLPTPSLLDQFQLVKSGESEAKGAWRLSVRIKVFFVGT